MARTFLITGAASGIGKATKELLEERGNTVIGVDLSGTDIDGDLSTPAGREALPGAVAQAAPDGIDAVIAVAGVALPTSLTVKVNYFGMKATLESLRPLLAESSTPRAALVASFSTLQENDHELVALMLSDDEAAATTRADTLADAGKGDLIYASTKRAIAEWMRTASVSEDWAGAGIPLNGVGPGIILTPMTAPMMETEEGRAGLMSIVPMPLNGAAEPGVIAHTLAYLTSEENTHMAGQLLFVDGGADVVIRGPHVFGTYAQ